MRDFFLFRCPSKQDPMHQHLPENTYHKAEENMIYATEEDPDIHMMWDSDEHPYTWWIEVNCMGSNVAYFDVIDEDDEDGQTWARCCIIDCSNIL